jgi:hypothetical protein
MDLDWPKLGNCLNDYAYLQLYCIIAYTIKRFLAGIPRASRHDPGWDTIPKLGQLSQNGNMDVKTDPGEGVALQLRIYLGGQKDD